MPCGGIYPVGTPGGIPFGESGRERQCFYCHKSGADYFCEEWDCSLHRACILPFLATEEGGVVLAHGHQIIIEEGEPLPQLRAY